MELWQQSALELGRLIADREVSAVDVLDAILARVDEHNPVINAVVTRAADTARAEAEQVDARIADGEDLGPLAGVPITIKDLTEVKGVRTTYGSTYFRDHVPERDAVLVERLRAAECPILGKTNAPEFGGKYDTENEIFGATLNPWDWSRSPGGSSGGAAAQVAAGMGPLAHGNDGGGSIRVPAACCGVFGLKPQHGRVPFWPRQDGWARVSHEGPITRTVRDAAALLDVMAGPDARDFDSIPAPEHSFLEACEGDVEGLRIAWSPTPGYGRVDHEVRSICEAAAHVFDDLGCHVEEAEPDLPDPQPAFLGTVLPRLATQFERDLPDDFRDRLDPALTNFLPFVDDMSVQDAARSEFAIYHLWDHLTSLFEQYDLFLTPTLATPAHPSGQFGPEKVNGMPVDSPLDPIFTFPFNLTGQPAASVPAGWTEDGLPVGLQIVGRRYDEATVLRAAARLEEARPWHDRWPEL